MKEKEKAEKLKDIALKVIEWLVSDDFSESISMDLLDNRKFSQKDAQSMGRKIATIYRYSHSVNPHTCYEVHDNWRQELLDSYKTMKQKDDAKKKEVTAKDGTKYRNIGAYIDSGT